jgi:hypothetical protein
MSKSHPTPRLAVARLVVNRPPSALSEPQLVELSGRLISGFPSVTKVDEGAWTFASVAGASTIAVAADRIQFSSSAQVDREVNPTGVVSSISTVLETLNTLAPYAYTTYVSGTFASATGSSLKSFSGTIPAIASLVPPSGQGYGGGVRSVFVIEDNMYDVSAETYFADMKRVFLSLEVGSYMKPAKSAAELEAGFLEQVEFYKNTLVPLVATNVDRV